MPKANRFPVERGRVKLRILDLEIEGGEESLAETVKSAVAAALTRNGAREQAKALRQDGNHVALPGASDEIVEEAEIIEHEETQSPSPRRPAQQRKLRKMNVLPLDFSTAEKSISDSWTS